jgi:hypothetical protein
MKVIRDEATGGIDTFAVALQWHICFCHQRGCTKRVTTVVTGAVMPNGDTIDFALCEEHFQAGNVPGGFQYDLDTSGESQREARQDHGAQGPLP